jgi:hypothetical protein
MLCVPNESSSTFKQTNQAPRRYPRNPDDCSVSIEMAQSRPKLRDPPLRRSAGSSILAPGSDPDDAAGPGTVSLVVYWFNGKRSFKAFDFTYRFGAFSPIPNGKIGRLRAAPHRSSHRIGARVVSPRRPILRPVPFNLTEC